MIRYISLLLFIGIISGQDYDYGRLRSPYISPGFQIGTNFDKQYFWGIQLSGGLIIQSFNPNEHIDFDFICPAICYGYRKYFKSKKRENYYDFQITAFTDIMDAPFPPINFGIGRIQSDDYNSLRIKVYTPILFCPVLDFEFETRKFNFSLISVAPIGNY